MENFIKGLQLLIMPIWEILDSFYTINHLNARSKTNVNNKIFVASYDLLNIIKSQVKLTKLCNF